MDCRELIRFKDGDCSSTTGLRLRGVTTEGDLLALEPVSSRGSGLSCTMGGRKSVGGVLDF